MVERGHQARLVEQRRTKSERDVARLADHAVDHGDRVLEPLRDGRIGRDAAQHLQVDLGGGERLAELVVQFARYVAALLFLRRLEAAGELAQARVGFLEFALAALRLRERVFALPLELLEHGVATPQAAQTGDMQPERQQHDGGDRHHAKPEVIQNGGTTSNATAGLVLQSPKASRPRTSNR